MIREIRKRSGTVIEVLIPDFRGHAEDLQRVIDAGPEVINHNIETVERLHPVVRPSARYERSLELLQRVTQTSGTGIKAKSGIMLGLGEQDDEIDADARATWSRTAATCSRSASTCGRRRTTCR